MDDRQDTGLTEEQFARIGTHAKAERERTLAERSLVSYDRRRMMEDEVRPDRLHSLRDANWEHQAAAMAMGYKSVLEMAVDQLGDLVNELETRVEALERMRTG